MSPSQPSPPITVTVKEAQRLSGFTHGQIYEAMNQGVLASCKVLGRRLILYESLVGLLTARADSRPPSAFALNPRGSGQLSDGSP